MKNTLRNIVFVALTFDIEYAQAIGQLTPWYEIEQNYQQYELTRRQMLMQQLEFQRQQQQRQQTIQKIVDTCLQLGFQPNTPEFNNCLTKLAN